MNALEIHRLWKSYRIKNETTTVLQDINLAIKERETVAVMGPSGSGKTTLLNLISGIDQANQGEITLAGNKLSAMNKSELALLRRKRLGLVFQDFNLLDCLNVRENILLPMALEKIEHEQQDARLTELAEIFHITAILKQNVADISGGEKQRVAIARAVANNPTLILADEPTGNLDSKSTKDVMTYLIHANEAFGATLLLVTHDPFAASYCQKVVLLKDGAILLEQEKKGTRQFFQDILKLQLLIGGDTDDL